MQNDADSLCQSAFLQHMWTVEYHYPMIKVEWFAAGVLLIRRSVYRSLVRYEGADSLDS